MSSPPLFPDHPVLAEVARELEKTRGASLLCDSRWTLVWVSEELRALIGEDDPASLGYGKHIVEAYLSGPWSAHITPESQMQAFFTEWPIVMNDTPGGRVGVLEAFQRGVANWDQPPDWVELEEVTEEALETVISQLEPVVPPPVWSNVFDYVQGDLPPTPITQVHTRLHSSDGEFVGTAVFYDPGLPARVLSLVSRGDEAMFERMARLIEPGRKQAAVLFADLQASSALSRRLPSAAYFRLISALTTAIDEVVCAREGIVGKHAGDGATAFFLADDLGSSSGAARAAIQAAKDISSRVGTAAKSVAEDTGLVEGADLQVNVGVHWGGMLYMGQLVTSGRLEVTALGDAVNECARIQAAASDGELLVSKNLIEHLSPEDAAAVDVDPDAVVYRTVAELPGVSPKAVRDAGTIPVTPL